MAGLRVGQAYGVFYRPGFWLAVPAPRSLSTQPPTQALMSQDTQSWSQPHTNTAFLAYHERTSLLITGHSVVILVTGKHNIFHLPQVAPLLIGHLSQSLSHTNITFLTTHKWALLSGHQSNLTSHSRTRFLRGHSDMDPVTHKHCIFNLS